MKFQDANYVFYFKPYLVISRVALSHDKLKGIIVFNLDILNPKLKDLQKIFGKEMAKKIYKRKSFCFKNKKYESIPESTFKKRRNEIILLITGCKTPAMDTWLHCYNNGREYRTFTTPNSWFFLNKKLFDIFEKFYLPSWCMYHRSHIYEMDSVEGFVALKNIHNQTLYLAKFEKLNQNSEARNAINFLNSVEYKKRYGIYLEKQEQFELEKKTQLLELKNKILKK